jgi:hypothetical protein
MTYEGPSSELLQDDIVRKLKQLNAKYTITKENVASDRTKYHCELWFEKRFRTRNPSKLEINGIKPIVLKIPRPSITTVKASAKKTNKDATPWDYIHSADTKEQYWQRCHLHAKKEVITNFLNLKAYADNRYRIEEPTSDDNLPSQEETEMQNWIIDTIGDTRDAASSSDYQNTSTIIEQLPEPLRSTALLQTTSVDPTWDNIIPVYQPVLQLQECDYIAINQTGWNNSLTAEPQYGFSFTV